MKDGSAASISLQKLQDVIKSVKHDPLNDVTVYVQGVRDEHGVIVPMDEARAIIVRRCASLGVSVIVSEYVPEGKDAYLLPKPRFNPFGDFGRRA